MCAITLVGDNGPSAVSIQRLTADCTSVHNPQAAGNTTGYLCKNPSPPAPLPQGERGDEIVRGESAQPWRGMGAQRRRGIVHEGEGARILKAPQRDALPAIFPEEETKFNTEF